MSWYIGICDFPDGKQAGETTDLYSTKLGTSPAMDDRALMIGAMMSFKTLTNIPSKWTTVWPDKEKIHEIFLPNLSAYNTIHYADYDGVTQLSHLLQVRQYGGTYLDAIQLDMVWPNPRMILDFRHKEPLIDIVLQINTRALAMMGDNPNKVVAKLQEYNGSVTSVLLDKSHGRGLGMDANVLLPFVRAIAYKLPSIGLGAAGGLGPGTVRLVEPIVREFPKLSIDAQGKLRPSGNAMDPIDWNMAHQYLREADELFSRYC